MSLTTVDIILNFAIDLEASAAAFYETAITITQTQDLKSLFEALIMQGQSRIQTLMQLRRQLSLDQKKATVTGVNSQQYRPKTECPPRCPDSQLIQLALALEQQIRDFYKDSSDKLGFLDDLPDKFNQLAKNHLQNQKNLYTAG
jgi:ArsR family metal-binding transcriptional regulator